MILLLTVDAAHAAPPAKPRPYQPITPPDYQWVDAEGKWSRAKGDAGGDSAGLAGTGSGNGRGSAKGLSSGSGTGNGSGTGTEFTQNPNGGKGAGGGQGSQAQSGSSSTPGGSIVIHDLWWPICVFVDETIDQAKANQAIKGQIEMANACGVNVVVWPKTVKSSSWNQADPDDVNSKALKNCNIPKELAEAGAASSLVTEDLTAAKMCGARKDMNNDGDENDPGDWDAAVAGCAQLRQGTDTSKFKASQTQGEGGGSAASSGIAPSIEVPSGHDASTLAHESQGHSQFGKPNGEAMGLGIGDDPDRPGAGGSGWSPSGCAQMQKTALKNTRRFGFDPQRQSYYIKPRNPDAFYDMTADPPIFQQSQNFVLNKGNGSIATPPGQTITFKDDSKGQNPPQEKNSAVDKKGQATETLDGEDTRHRRKNVVNALLDSLKEEGGLVEDPTRPQVRKPSAPPNSDPVKASPRLGYDDNAPKGNVGSSGGDTVTSAEPSPTDVYSGATAPGDSSGLAVGSREPEGSGTYVGGAGKGASIGYDESAPKGGLVGGASVGSPGYGTADGASGALLRVVGSLNGDYKKTSGSDGEDEFFDGVGEGGRKIRRRTPKRTTSLRESPQREPREPSAVGRASRSQRAPASSP